MNLRAIGLAVRRARTAKGLTQVNAAHDAGMAPRTWTDLENGRLNPTLNTLRAASQVVGVPVSELIREGER